jgi:tRNA(Ser,Leu) C12 N-acetylase TAN1
MTSTPNEETSSATPLAKLVVTARDVLSQRRTRAALRRALPGATVARHRDFRAVFVVEVAGDPIELAETVSRECTRSIGRVVPALAEVESRAELVRQAAIEVGAARIGAGESFGFRLHKRGRAIDRPSPELEREIGGAVWVALERRDGAKPRVDLSDPDVEVTAEVLGPTTVVGIIRKAWR